MKKVIDVKYGVPALNTKTDYFYIKEHFSDEVWRPKFQSLLDNKMNWLNTGKLADGEDGITDDTHKIIENKNEEGVVVERYQYEYKEDSNCRLFKLGFTVQEVEGIL